MDSASFGPDDLRLMGRAFQEACGSLPDGEAETGKYQQEMARAVIEACGRGLREKAGLVAAAVAAAQLPDRAKT
jgi:hypothetical protein